MHGQDKKYWKKTKFEKSTYWEDELNGIINKGIKVNTFYMQPKAKESFSIIAQRTKGDCQNKVLKFGLIQWQRKFYLHVVNKDDHILV